MNQKQKASLPSVNRSVTKVEPPPFLEYFKQRSALPRQPDEFLMNEFMEATGMSERCARRALDSDIKQGKIKVRTANLNGGAKLYSVIK